MKIFNKIVWSSKEPNNHSDIWFDGSTFQIYNNGTWESITLEIEAAEKVAEILKDVSNLYQEKLIAGKGIQIENNVISSTALFKIVDSLPETGEEDVIYLVLSENPSEENVLIEYIYINNAWEKLGEFSNSIDFAIPDWNASEGEAGFIKNKTHGYKKYITVRAGRNIMNDFNGQRMFLYALDGKIYTLNLSYPTKTTIGEGDTEAIVEFIFSNSVEISVTPVGANTQNVDVYGWLLENDIYEPLADGFIPDTIARKSELTELSAEVGKKVDADFVNNAIAAAIGEAIDGGY